MIKTFNNIEKTLKHDLKKVILYVLKSFLWKNLKTQKYGEISTEILRKKISQLIKSHKMIVNIDMKEAIIHTIKLFYL